MDEAKKNELKQKFEAEMAEWQTKIDEVKVQLSLGAMDAKDELNAQLRKLEAEVAQAKVDFDKFDKASTHAWNDFAEGLSKSFDTMKEAFTKAKENYK